MGKSRKSKKRDLWEDAPMESFESSEPPRSLQLSIVPPIVPPSLEHTAAAAACQATLQSVLSDTTSPTLLVVEPFLTASECEAWIAWGEGTGFAHESHPQTAYTAHRDNGRLAVTCEATAAAIFDRVSPLLPPLNGRKACACSPNIRLYKYTVGQRFGKHVDVSSRLRDGSETQFTLLCYLNEVGLSGGETRFYYDGNGAREAYRFAPKAGAVLLHAHGARCLTHEGDAVTAGVKYVLRTDVSYR